MSHAQGRIPSSTSAARTPISATWSFPEIEKRTGRAGSTTCRSCSAASSSSTNNRSPAEAIAGIKNKPEYQELETERFLTQHGITRFRPNPFFPVNTLMIMRGAVAARKLGIFERYVDVVFRHMWAEPKKMDDPAVLRAALVEIGVCRPIACSSGPRTRR